MSKLKVSIAETAEALFLFQSMFNKPFALFLTFPESGDTDTDEYKVHVKNVIESNLNDPNNQNFKNRFEADYTDVDKFKLRVVSRDRYCKRNY